MQWAAADATLRHSVEAQTVSQFEAYLCRSRRARPGCAAAAALETAAVAWPRGSKWFAQPGAIACFVGAHAIKKGRVKMAKVRETLGNGAGPSCARRAQGAFPLDGVHGTAPAGARAKIRPGAKTAPVSIAPARRSRHKRLASR